MSLAQGNVPSLLNKESCLVLSPTLAKLIGDRQALLLQQIQYWLDINEKTKNTNKYSDGRWWTYNTYEAWVDENFPFWSARMLRRLMKDLEEKGLVIARKYNSSDWKQTKWYTIDYEAVKSLESAETTEMLESPDLATSNSRILATSSRPNGAHLYTENTNKEYTHSRALDSEQSSGVCNSSLEAPLRGEPEVEPHPGQSSKVQKPTPKADASHSKPDPLEPIHGHLKVLGIKPNDALRTAANGLTKTELIRACGSLKEAIEAESVRNKQVWLVSAFKNRYEPSEDWAEQKRKEAERRKARQAAEKQRDAENQIRRQRIEEVKSYVAGLVESGEVILHSERSDFSLDGGYWFEYPGINYVSYCHSVDMPPSRDEITQFAKKLAARSA